jgi:hypothetical protein
MRHFSSYPGWVSVSNQVTAPTAGCASTQRAKSMIQSALVRPPRSTEPTSVIMMGLRAAYAR